MTPTDEEADALRSIVKAQLYSSKAYDDAREAQESGSVIIPQGVLDEVHMGGLEITSALNGLINDPDTEFTNEDYKELKESIKEENPELI